MIEPALAVARYGLKVRGMVVYVLAIATPTKSVFVWAKVDVLLVPVVVMVQAGVPVAGSQVLPSVMPNAQILPDKAGTTRMGLD